MVEFAPSREGPYLSYHGAHPRVADPLLSVLATRLRAFHIADDGLSTVIHMDVLDADKLLPAVTQASCEDNSRRAAGTCLAR